MIEIERKFKVVSPEYKELASNSRKIIQGFLNSNKNRIVRVRLTGNEGRLTVKGKSTDDGLERFEWETIISKNDALDLLDLCEKPMIEKSRYDVFHEGKLFEIDEFYGENEGLVIAELELKSKDELFNLPSWIGEEVTGDQKYYNANLITNPYKNWK
ncbi:CYTH domain-containing protein [Aegicerativicinus sediminis]|uniref:CYTH domain-containing protein n=1 Tax=Aegicerativicinus sediminis TaxID=2893202 RepID=UPI001E37B50A|nr:CYTH domain-containing protein [Aegicerativicinus sediminis]